MDTQSLTLMLAPFAPFLAEELWREALGNERSVHLESWPTFDLSLAAKERITLVVQVDGKVRDRLEVDADADDATIERLAKGSDGARRALDGRDVAKVIVRAPKLVNFVTQR